MLPAQEIQRYLTNPLRCRIALVADERIASNPGAARAIVASSPAAPDLRRGGGAVRERMDRGRISVGSAEELDRAQREEWARASIEERLETVTYLRECFYGAEATTGRLQRVHTVLERA
jgi:hypothetical protein